MKILRFRWGDAALYGVLNGTDVLPVKGDIFGDYTAGTERLSFENLGLLPPVAPSKVIAVGLNYPIGEQPARERATSADSILATPNVFSVKAGSSVVGPDDPIVYPRMLEEVHQEVELGVVIRRRATKVSPAHAFDYVLGYTIVNELMAWDLFVKEGSKLLSKCKGFDTFCPLGPVIETALDPTNLKLTARRNGTEVQSGNTRDLLVKIPDLIGRISDIMTLLPGDVIATGTPLPPEVGRNDWSRMTVKPGDVLELEIERIGTLRNKVVAESGDQ